MEIEVVSLNNVLLDGVPAGTIVDVLSNYPDHRRDLLTACQQWELRLTNAISEQHTTEITELTSTYEKLIETRDAEIVKLLGYVNAVSSTKEAKRMEKEARRKDAAARKAEAEAELAELDA